MAAAMDLISAAYGWTDEQILDRPLSRLTQIVAAIHRRQWLDDLAHRRLETAKLRTLCAYVAASIQLEEGADNVMITEAARLSLGTGTEPVDDPGQPATLPVERWAPPAATVTLDRLPDAPPSVRVGQPAAEPPGVRPVPFERLGRLLGGGPA